MKSIIRYSLYREALYRLRVLGEWCEERGMRRTQKVVDEVYGRVLERLVRG